LESVEGENSSVVVVAVVAVAAFVAVIEMDTTSFHG